jgi:hypothetical protein
MNCVFKAFFFISTLITASLLFAQADDHLALDQAKALYAQSVFAHGYRHGYEEGFHIGDQDLQMGRRIRNCEKISEYKHGHDYFKSSFGDKSGFEKGYRQGFSRGYDDAYSGREFQVVNSGRVAALGISNASFSNVQLRAFDSGFATGFDTAVKNGMRDSSADPEYATQSCEKSSNSGPRDREIFCQGYARGVLFGAVQNGESRSEVVARYNNRRY